MSRITIVIALFAAAIVAHDLPAAQGGMPALSSEPFNIVQQRLDLTLPDLTPS